MTSIISEKEAEERRVAFYLTPHEALLAMQACNELAERSDPVAGEILRRAAAQLFPHQEWDPLDHIQCGTGGAA